MTQPTPRPWRIPTDNPDCVLGPNHEFVARAQNDDTEHADARLIVKAVNAHDQIVAALEMAIKCSAPSAVGLPSAWIDKAKAALAKAKGET